MSCAIRFRRPERRWGGWRRYHATGPRARYRATPGEPARKARRRFVGRCARHSGPHHFEKGTRLPRKIIERAVDATRSIVDQGHHVLTVAVSADDMMVEADPVRLEQVVVNLLANAAKYTPSGGQVRVSVERRGEDAVLGVRDSGVGIGPEMLPRVFDLFAQGERALDRCAGRPRSRPLLGTSGCGATRWLD